MSAVMERPAIGWSPAHTATAHRAAERRAEREAWGVMRPCSWCWGQRTVYRLEAGALVRETCERCEGIGLEVVG